MTFVDLLIIVAILASILVGVIRGIVREAVAIAALLVAIWAALHLGPYAGGWLGGSMGSTELELWAGRFLVFIIILAIVGGLTGWAVSKVVRMAGMTITDRILGGIFGFVRAVVLIGLFALLGRYAAFDVETWWLESSLIPYAETVADWVEVMAPKGMEMLQPDEMMDEFKLSAPDFN
jgi:membrane protein required for colicin V production